MSDSNKLTYDELVQINDELRYIISNLKKEKEELRLTVSELRLYKDDMEKFSQRSTVYDPNKMLGDQKTLIEQKVKYAVLQKDKEIDALKADIKNLEDTIIPLQNQVKDKNIQLDTAYNIDRSNKERIKELENVITNQNATIHMAAGYISSTPQFKNQHPMNVLKWLRGIHIT
jgi:uncharacterized coiled-coil protein SlyX